MIRIEKHVKQKQLLDKQNIHDYRILTTTFFLFFLMSKNYLIELIVEMIKFHFSRLE